MIVVLFIIYALETEDTSPKLVEPTNTESSKTDDSTVSADSNSNNEIRVFTIGDTASINGYEIRVNKVEYSSGGEWMKPDEGNEFVIVNLTITNN
ncbi:DUF4352 domain-containing protein [Enterococcus sp.]|uniref:DUF4352 domain-containing protein n=1 Tax=Enterococcus sp. TaxID=35783 RepID=UPI00289D7D68|nr:DUF4352 domain-containing protein [Enterococcus sp.]